jgi:hypothetical protein
MKERRKSRRRKWKKREMPEAGRVYEYDDESRGGRRRKGKGRTRIRRR